MCEERQSMGDVRQQVCDEDACVVHADNTLHSPTANNEERCAMDAAPLPPYNGDDDADKTVRSRTTRARVFLGIGLALEAFATIWAFQQAVSAGALSGDVYCGNDDRNSKLLGSSAFEDECGGQIDIDVFNNYSNTLTERYSSNQWEEYVSCDSLTDAPTAQDDVFKLCSCSVARSIPYSCAWVALSPPGDDICYAQGVLTNSSDGTIVGVSDGPVVLNCVPLNPQGTVGLTITALVVALSSQLLEAFVGFKYWKDTEQRTAPTLGVSVFEALGVLTVSAVLLSLPGLYTVSDDTPHQFPAFFWMAWTVVIIVIVGALAEITAECCDRSAGRLQYLGAVGNGLIWAGAAMLEVLVTFYIIFVGVQVMTNAEFALEIGTLFALELFGLVAMWIARGLWTSAKLLRSLVKTIDRPLRERAINTHFR